MTIDQAFLAANVGIMAFWALLIIAPNWSVTHALVHRPVLPLALALAYIAYALPGFILPGGKPEGGGFGSLAEVMVLFTSKPAVMAGWIHYLVFDLFVGAWEARDAKRLGFPHWLLIPCLILTLLLGPVGLALYLTLRWALKKRWTLVETD
jgi:hypothetical protein